MDACDIDEIQNLLFYYCACLREYVREGIPDTWYRAEI